MDENFPTIPIVFHVGHAVADLYFTDLVLLVTVLYYNHVLGPYIAQLFNLLNDKQGLHPCVLEASLALCIRRAPFRTPTITAYILSVNGTMYRMYANMPMLFALCLLSDVWQLVRSLTTPNMVFTQTVTLCNLCSFFGTYNMLHVRINPSGHRVARCFHGF